MAGARLQRLSWGSRFLPRLLRQAAAGDGRSPGDDAPVRLALA